MTTLEPLGSIEPQIEELEDSFPADPFDYDTVVKPALEALKEQAAKGQAWLSQREVVLLSAHTAPREETEFLMDIYDALDLSKLTPQEAAKMVFNAVNAENYELAEYISLICSIDLTALPEEDQQLLLFTSIECSLPRVFKIFYKERDSLDLAETIRELNVSGLLSLHSAIQKIYHECGQGIDASDSVSLLIFAFDTMSPEGKPLSEEGHDIACALFNLLRYYPEVFKDLNEEERAIFDRISNIYFDEFHQRVVLGLIHGVKNTAFAYEGSNELHSAVLMDKAQKSTAVYDDTAKPYLSEAELNSLHAALKGTNPDCRLVYTGFRSHAVFVVLHREGYMVVCNRGAENNHLSMQTFWIDFSKVSAEVIEKLQAMKDKSAEEFNQYVYQQLPEELSPTNAKAQDDFCVAMEEFSPKDQHVGNCYWANLKTAVRAIVALNGLKNVDGAAFGPALQKAKGYSKSFSASIRFQTCQEYRSRHQRRIPPMFDTHLDKQMQDKTQDHLLRVAML